MLMNYAVYNIALDIHKTGSQVALSMIRGENKRKIVISLTENGRPYKITEGCTAVFTAIKPDGNFIYNDCEIDIENNQIIYYVTSQTTAVMGMVDCQIKLIGNDGGLLYSPTLSLVVGDTLYNEQPIVASSEEFNALTNYVASLQKKLADGEFKGDKGDKGDTGAPGTSVTVASVTESTADSGSNVIKFSDGKSVTIKNGSKGSKGDAGKDADVSELAPAIVCTSTGAAIAVSDSSESGFEAFSIYGKSTQNGTPTPSAPIDIVSVGEDGNIRIDVNGKNLLKINKSEIGVAFVHNGITFIRNADGGVTMNGTATATAFYNMDCDNGEVKYPTQTKLIASASGLVSGITLAAGYFNAENVAVDSVANVRVSTPSVEYELPKGTKRGRTYLMVAQGTTLQNVVVYPMIRLSTSNSVFEQAKAAQSLSVDLLNKLKGIPVTDKSLATYTDANGQMWCADEIDLERGVYIQRIKRRTYDSSVNIRTNASKPWHYSIDVCTDMVEGNVAYSTKIIRSNFFAPDETLWIDEKLGILANFGDVIIGYPNTTKSDFIALISDRYAAGNPLYIEYVLAHPIETPLTAEQIAAYKALKTNYPSTTIANDENAFMKVGYRADTKNFIKRMVGSTTQISSVTISASKWVGTASPYSQVVTIPGTTKNSKIDLNPTVEQLSIFHNKDIAFVVGNNNGVITVYCIGQKPANDYTIQATITEVAING